MQMRFRWAAVALALTAAGWTSGCSGGGGGGGSSAATIDLLLKDAPVDDLLSFEVTVTAARLVGPGGPTQNLLNAPERIELLGLQAKWAWLARVDLPDGAYTAIELDLDASSVEARDPAGADVAVTVAASQLTLPLSPALSVSGGSYGRVRVDIDLERSLSGDVATPPLTFTPAGTAVADGGQTELRLDQIQGQVFFTAESASRVSIDAFQEALPNRRFARVGLVIRPGALLLDASSTPFPSQAAFFAALNFSTVLETHGSMGSAGTVFVERARIADGMDDVVLQGVIVGVDTTNNLLYLRIREVEDDGGIAGPILDGLGNPPIVTVLYGAPTVFFRADGAPADASELAVGLDARVEFATFSSEPFPAQLVELGDIPPSAEGKILDVAGIPSSFVMHALATDPVVVSGLVDSDTTDITVQLSATEIVLHLDARPTLMPTALLTGLELEVEGPVGGTPLMPTIAADLVRVRPGRFEGTVTATTPGTSSFDATVNLEIDPFGDTVTMPPYAVVLDPTAVFTGAATTETEFFDAFTNLMGGETLEVVVFGIGTGNPEEILAYEVHAVVMP